MKTATLHSLEIRSLAEKICQHPIWVDLKGKDSVPETVYHLVVEVDSYFFLFGFSIWVDLKGKDSVPMTVYHWMWRWMQ